MATVVTDEYLLSLVERVGTSIPALQDAISHDFPNYSFRSNRIQKRLEKLRIQGHLPLDSGNYVSVGEVLKGTSTLYDESGGIRLQWVKTDIPKQTQLDTFKEAIEALVDTLSPLPPQPLDAPSTFEDCLTYYPIADAHIGMAASLEETGVEWDLAKSTECIKKVMKSLVEATPKTKKAVVANLGDYFHRDNMAGYTERSKHLLDTSGTYLDMVLVGLDTLIYTVQLALAKHEQVEVYNLPGNHDDTSALFLQAALGRVFSNEPRVTVHLSQRPYQYHKFGQAFIGMTHGHLAKPDKLPLIMATDEAANWGDSVCRYWMTAHIHHETVKEYTGCTVFSFRTIAAKDNYAYTNGYRAGRDASALVFSQKGPIVQTHKVSVAPT